MNRSVVTSIGLGHKLRAAAAEREKALPAAPQDFLRLDIEMVLQNAVQFDRLHLPLMPAPGPYDLTLDYDQESILFDVAQADTGTPIQCFRVLYDHLKPDLLKTWEAIRRPRDLLKAPDTTMRDVLDAYSEGQRSTSRVQQLRHLLCTDGLAVSPSTAQSLFVLLTNILPVPENVYLGVGREDAFSRQPTAYARMIPN